MKSFALLFSMILVYASLCQAESIQSDTSKLKTKPTEKVISSYYSDPTIDCEKIVPIKLILSEAINVGAPTYNEGNHIGCYRVYEGTAYKILYKYGSQCKEVANILEAALEKSYGDYTVTEKAWIMRVAFDQILGVPTTTK